MLMGWLSTDLYVQIHEGRLSVTNLDTGDEVTSATIVAVPRREGEKPRLVEASELEAATIEEEQGRIELIDGFGHDRVLIGDFEAAEFALKSVVRSLLPGWWTRIGSALVHIQREIRGGVTTVELRAVRDLMEYAGAKHTRLYLRPTEVPVREVRRLLSVEPGREPHLLD
jgi:hypothetical protein